MTASSSASAAEASAGPGAVTAPLQFDSEKLPQTLVLEIRPFLRVANQIEAESPRVAYLCRFHAFEKAHMLDPRSTGRGVRQFKTTLLQRLEQDEKSTFSKRKERNDAREIKSFYEKKKQANAHQLMPVLGEVLKAVLIGTGLESLVASEDFGDKSGFRYNIIPLHPRSSQQPIMLLQEIKVAVSAVFNVRSLPLANVKGEKSQTDIFRWLQSWFGFQLDERAVEELLAKTFESYLTWCKFLGRKSNIWLPSVKQEIQQHKLLYISLYLLIWGEASNLRLMPECLCYIFHHMSYELYGVLSGAVSLITGEKEALKNKNGVSDHSTWRNYDDLNEFFWQRDWDGTLFRSSCKQLYRDIYLANLQYIVLVVPGIHHFGRFFYQVNLYSATTSRSILWTHKFGILYSVPFSVECVVSFIISIRTMGMVRSRFCTLPEVFNACLVPRSSPKEKKGILPSFLEKKIFKVESDHVHFTLKDLGKSERHDPTKFALVWNQIINSFRSEDLISNREMDLMTMPMSLEYRSGSIRWPLFLVAKKFSTAVDMAANFTGNSAQLFQRIKKDNYMFCAINDFYELTKSIFRFLVIGDVEKRFYSG
uniref:1,3-beta-glucan synthase component FKS1-like domain-containing protein n=1 Tax=Aegilops tauschii TaxID=37682 RepID=M8B6D1_AEGTA